MVVYDQEFALEVVFLIVVPAAAGVLLTRFGGDEAKRRGAFPLAVRLLRTAITAIWVVIVAIGVSLAFGPFSFLSTLTASAIAGVAVTLALQTTLQNILAGFILLRNQFMHLGDHIQISGLKGEVVGLGVVSVTLRLDDGSLATVSNATLLSGPLVNYTATQRLKGEY